MKRDNIKTQFQKGEMLAGEAAQMLGVGVQTLHYYEQLGLIPRPPRTSSGYRLYTPEIVERVRFIRKAQTLGFSLDEIKETFELAKTGTSPCGQVQKVLVDKLREVERRLDELHNFRDELAALIAQAPKLSREKREAQVCSIVEEAPLLVTSITSLPPQRKRQKDKTGIKLH
ncbi:MAG: heavy metal-responsive transcriptional regulator [Acidobacteria bacterium]|jgi:DNA-binding transcriptional MerR regulator|nr:heavy metal-responsive transcriptional regulator [Acidobacteriota bacterium]